MTRVPWRHLGEIIPAVLTVWQKDKGAPIHKVRQLWQTAVGLPAASHTVPLVLREGLLVVSVDSHIWAAELAQRLTDGIVRTLNNAFGCEVIRELRFIARLSPRSPETGEKTDAEPSEDKI